MRSRSISALAASLLLAVACGGGAFSSGDGGDGAGASSGAGGQATGGRGNQGGKSGSGPMTGTAGSKPGGGASGGGTAPGSAGDSSAGESSGGEDGSGGAAGGSSGPECTLPADCHPSTKCKLALCEIGGVCSEQNLPNGPYTLQVSGDCKRLECSDGKEVIVVDAADSDDKNECTTDSCGAGGSAVHTARYGEPCSAGSGICSAAGKCELCSRDLCPATACSMPICAEGKCLLAPKPSGTFCNGFEDQCDGAGNCIDCVNSGGCGECCVCSAAHACIPA